MLKQQLAIDPREWRWVSGWTVLIVLLTSLPYLVGVFHSTPENQFGGFVINLEDGNSYLAKIQEGRAGYWLFYLAYTPEPHTGAPFFGFYLLLGKVARLLELSSIVVLHISRVLTSAFALISFYVLTAYFVRDIPIRRTAYLLFGLTAGFGWLWLTLGLPFDLDVMPVDFWVPEASYFLSALTFPHLPLSLGLQLWFIVGTLWYLDSGYWPGWSLAAGVGLLISWIHPFKLAIVLPLFGILVLWRAYQRQGNLRTDIYRLILVTLPTLPYIAYTAIVFETNFALQGWRLQNLIWSPPMVLYVLGFGLILPLTGLGVWRLGAYPVNHRAFLVIWLVVAPLLVYLPISLQRRFLDGFQAILALLGGIGAVYLLNHFRRPYRLPVSVAGLLIMSLTNLLLLAGAVMAASSGLPPHFHSASQQSAFIWLARNSEPRQVVLAAYRTGNLLPAYAPLQVFVGHSVETINFDARMEQVDRFFEQTTSDEWRRTLLDDYGVDFVFYGPNEQAAGDFDPASAPYLTIVYDKDQILIFRVQR